MDYLKGNFRWKRFLNKKKLKVINVDQFQLKKTPPTVCDTLL